ncbi:hypothetical protein BU14_0257s0009 [Porphyra umbilicalis]|uniref:Prefoldin subunit 6 n=1 Tax=Porphyra umbilicalis TaxID=2786 RepID=A0A1X6P2E2_PORUM|nr:hypothetical protein BU14_0257s0009 [Porphyra umbilicalis]|eukprot:OSX75039.1 hypothetical protein BU14_0257s0009 [Porphyra umbilicalis]
MMSDAVVPDATKTKLEAIMQNMIALQKEASKAMSAVMGLKNQFLENQLVAKELDEVPDGTAVYKLVGPVLLAEELEEARTNVRTRLSKISEQLQAGNNRVHAIETEMEQKRASLIAFQTELQKQEMAQMQGGM